MGGALWALSYSSGLDCFKGDIFELTNAVVSILSAYQNMMCTGRMRFKVVDRVCDSALARPEGVSVPADLGLITRMVVEMHVLAAAAA